MITGPSIRLNGQRWEEVKKHPFPRAVTAVRCGDRLELGDARGRRCVNGCDGGTVGNWEIPKANDPERNSQQTVDVKKRAGLGFELRRAGT